MEKQTKNLFERVANKITWWAGSSFAFLFAIGIVVIWIVTGSVFHYSDSWQLVINTGTSIITFLMVFLIQKAQNKDSKAIQLKLNELIAASRHTSNRMVDIEDLGEKELDELRRFYKKLSDLAEQDDDIHRSHSIDKAEKLQDEKRNLENRNNDAGLS
ncbi:low affinity iron permease family protein [Rubrolithibacter danxiaensis]|uniref:low affinity iron permease family protein n=1 Tax=Rubrolithibacter danxiaensis TaxID=3390805 RepID=UPI003BF8F60D